MVYWKVFLVVKQCDSPCIPYVLGMDLKWWFKRVIHKAKMIIAIINVHQKLAGQCNSGFTLALMVLCQSKTIAASMMTANQSICTWMYRIVLCCRSGSSQKFLLGMFIQRFDRLESTKAIATKQPVTINSDMAMAQKKVVFPNQPSGCPPGPQCETTKSGRNG